MTDQAAPSGPSLQDCLLKLEEALRIVMQDSRTYYLKTAQEATVEALGQVSLHFVQVSSLMWAFFQSWLDSRKSGPDAISPSEKLEERIDIKLAETGKMDFELLKRIMKRLHRADDALLGLNRMDTYLSYLRELCRQKKLKGQFGVVNTFINGLLRETQNSIRSEVSRLSNQISRCNLYYDAVLKSRTVRIAFSSLLISACSFLISIISLSVRDVGTFQVLGFPQIFVLISSAVFIALICYLAVQWFER